MSPRSPALVPALPASCIAFQIGVRLLGLVLPAGGVAAIALAWRGLMMGGWRFFYASSAAAMVTMILLGVSISFVRWARAWAISPEISCRPSPARSMPTGAGCWQCLVRRHAPNGVEVAEGWETVHFLPGQRVAVVHVPFCPPFLRAPVVQASSTAPVLGAKVRVTHAWPHGARIELRLTVPPKRAVTRRASFVATCPPAES